MKTINVSFEDEEFDRLNSIKGSDSWREFILTLTEIKKKVQVK